jgi:cell division protein FtsB
VEESRPEPDRHPRDQADLGRRYARDEERDDPLPPRRLARIGEPPPAARRVPGAGAWREPRRLGPPEERPRTDLDDTGVLAGDGVEEVLPATRRGVPSRPEPERAAPVVADAPVAPAARAARVADGFDDDGDVDARRRPPSWYRRGDDDAPPVPHPHPRPRPARRLRSVADIEDDGVAGADIAAVVDIAAGADTAAGVDIAADVPTPSPPRVPVEVGTGTGTDTHDEPPRPRWEPRPLPEGEGPSRRLPRRRPSADPRPRFRPGGLPRKRVVAPADARVQPAVAASRHAHPTARPPVRPPAGGRRLAANWPGSHAGALPPDFPGGNGGDVVFHRPRPRALAVTDPPRSRRPKGKARAKPETTPADLLAAVPGDADPANDGGRRALPLRPPQRFNNIVGAVYAALADPLAADSAEAREQRAARVREVGLIAASSALVAVLVYGIFPVRTFLNQRAATEEAQERLEKIAEANERMRREAERLRDDEEIELRARSDYGWVFPGEESYGVLPSPVAEPAPGDGEADATTSSTTPEG